MDDLQILLTVLLFNKEIGAVRTFYSSSVIPPIPIPPLSGHRILFSSDSYAPSGFLLTLLQLRLKNPPPVKCSLYPNQKKEIKEA